LKAESKRKRRTLSGKDKADRLLSKGITFVHTNTILP
jgi:hypothetical protein